MGRISAYAEPRFAPLPPAKGRTNPAGINWSALTAPLYQRPNQWAAIGTVPAPASLGSRATKLRAKGIETTTRSNGDGTATIWACYVTDRAPDLPAPIVVADEIVAAWFDEQVA